MRKQTVLVIGSTNDPVASYASQFFQSESTCQVVNLQTELVARTKVCATKDKLFVDDNAVDIVFFAQPPWGSAIEGIANTEQAFAETEMRSLYASFRYASDIMVINGLNPSIWFSQPGREYFCMELDALGLKTTRTNYKLEGNGTWLPSQFSSGYRPRTIEEADIPIARAKIQDFVFVPFSSTKFHTERFIHKKTRPALEHLGINYGTIVLDDVDAVVTIIPSYATTEHGSLQKIISESVVNALELSVS